MLGERLQYLRLEKGMTQKELSKVFKVSLKTIQFYEQNRTIPDIYLVAEIPWKDVSQKQTIPHTTVIPIREKISLDMCLIYKKDKIFTKMSKDVIQEIKNYIQSILT